MGLAIGQTAARASGLSPAVGDGVHREQTHVGFGRSSSTETEGVRALFSGEPRIVVRAGFGEGTVSAPLAAVRTLDGGLESARRVVPSYEEVSAEQRSRRAEQREERARAAGENQARLQGVAAVAASRSFVNAVNEAAAVAQARLAGEEAPTAANTGATVEVNGQAFDIRTLANEVVPPTRPTFDVLA